MKQLNGFLPNDFLSRYGESVLDTTSELTEAVKNLLALVDGLSETDKDVKIVGNWKVAQVLHHLAQANILFLESIQASKRGEFLETGIAFLSEESKPIAPKAMEPDFSLSFEQALISFSIASKDLLNSVEDAKELTGKVALVHGFLGELDSHQCLQNAVWHIRHHTKQIQKALS